MQQIVSRLAPYILSLFIAVLGLFTGMSDVGEAIQVAIDPDKAIVQATEILNDTPPAEIKEALEAEGIETEKEEIK